MKKVKSLLNKMSSPMRPPAGLGDLRLIKSFVSKVFSLFITTQSAEDSRQRPSGMTALLDVKAFTLVELLVVVLIIGILSAIAIPMYQGAVDKSHWSTMLPASKAIKDAEEAIKMTNGYYTSNMDDLDVRMNSTDLDFMLDIKDSLSEPNVIRVTNSKLDNVRLASYLDDSPKFAGQLHCEAKNEGSTPNERGQRLCEKLLNGQYLKTTNDGYTRYLLDQAIDQATCGAATGSWSTSKTKCYKDTAARCEALNSSIITGTNWCGYEFTNGKTIKEEEVCFVDGSKSIYGCGNGIQIQPGGMCIAVNAAGPGGAGASCGSEGSIVDGGAVICVSSTDCGWKSTYTNGAVCVGFGNNARACSASFTNGSVCYANGSGSCVEGRVYYDATSCCCGAYCPSTAPTCASRGKTCDPYYMDPNNFKD